MINRHGFTFIELMIAVLVIGVLATIAIPNYQKMQDRAKDASVKSAAHNVQLAVEDYSVQNNGEYTDTAADLLPLFIDGERLPNPYTGALSEPQFSAPATSMGQVGIQVISVGGINTGYSLNGWGKDAELFSRTSGN